MEFFRATHSVIASAAWQSPGRVTLKFRKGNNLLDIAGFFGYTRFAS